MKTLKTRSLLVLGMGAALAACGGTSDSGGSSGTGTMSLGITDAPVDGATAVWVRFSGVAVKPADGEEIQFK